jgi:hypothetical protein
MAATLDLTRPSSDAFQRDTSALTPGTETAASPCPTLDRLLLGVMLLCFILMGANMLFDLLSVIWVR